MASSGNITRAADPARVTSPSSSAIRAVFPASGVGGRPPRINYECLGNLTHHIHWHVIPRHATDPAPRHTVWVWPPERQKGAMPPARRAQLVERLRAALTSPAGEVEPLVAAPIAGGMDPARAYRLAAVHAFLETHDMACYRCRTGLGGSTGERCPTCGYDLLTMVESVPAFSRDCPLCGASIPGSEVKLCWSCGAVNPRYLEVQIAKLSAAAGVPATHCLACGYDLAGIRDGVCPECGVPIGSSRA